jgi:DNA invertase Pin-like site-specific DNA recombinase
MNSYSMEVVRHADSLYDCMPLREIADVIKPSLRTLKNWSSQGLINSEKDWVAIRSGRDTKASVRKAVTLKRHNYTYEEIADKLNVSRRTAVNYVTSYADHI